VILQPDPGSVASVPRGEEFVVQWTVKNGQPVLRSWLDRYSGPVGPDCLCLTWLSIPPDFLAGTLVEGTLEDGTWEVRVDTTSLAAGLSQWRVLTLEPDGSGGEAFLDDKPDFSIRVEVEEGRSESDGPVLSLLSVSPPQLSSRSEKLTVRWEVEDESGLATVSGTWRGDHATGFASACPGVLGRPVGGNFVEGEVTDGRVTQGVFEATWEWTGPVS
ncbi:uncharacterized protein METZ01_LOCUS505680, partial [marine metagenome]